MRMLKQGQYLGYALVMIPYDCRIAQLLELDSLENSLFLICELGYPVPLDNILWTR